MKRFLDGFHGDLIRAEPELFRLKMDKAAKSDATFYRGFPQLYYAHLRRSSAAPALAATPRLLSAGDLHGENFELVDDGGRPAAQVNDFDDAMRAPVGLDIARTLGGAGLLGAPSDRRSLIREAAAAYRDSLELKFKEWAKAAAREKAVEGARLRDRDWPNRAGKPVEDASSAARLLKAARLGAPWKVFDRRGAGLSSIGLRRYMFVHRKHGHVFELKQLRPAAPLFFTQEPGLKSERPRIEAAFRDLRAVPAPASTLAFEGSEWLLRRREAQYLPPKLEETRSSARLMGGLAAQLHRGAAPRKDLLAALDSAGEDVVLEALDFMSRMRAGLKTLIKAGRW